MSMTGARARGQAGFSLVEVLAALFVFTLLTLGLVPLLTSSIRGSNTARADTIGKNVALKAMERVRGLPFHISYATSTDPVDVLDLYYPEDDNDLTLGSPAITFYRTTCPVDGPPACPVDIPADYTIQFDAQFVDPVATGTQPTPGETATSYQNVPPSGTYQWNSETNDTPVRQILQMAITVTWTAGETDESYTITSLLSDRDFGERKTKATATLGYGLDIYTAYDSNSGGGTDLSAGNVFIATSESDIEGRRLSTARQSSTTARGELQEDAGGSLGTAVAATSNVLQAPPDQEPGDIAAANGQLRHPEFSNAPVAVYGPTLVIDPRATATGLPFAIGDTEVTGVIPGQTEYVGIKDPQLTVQDYNELILSSAGTNGPSLVSLVANDGLAAPPLGGDPPTTGDIVVGGTRAITSATDTYAQATMGFDRLLMLKTTFIPNSAPWVDLTTGETGTLTGGQGAIVVIDDFQAATWCRSEDDGTGDGEAQFEGTLYYWEDPAANGSRLDGRYVRVTFDVDSQPPFSPDPLAGVMRQNVQAGQANGPLIYDHASANQRIYLFGKTLGRSTGGGGGQRLAYLTSWNSLTTTSHRIEDSTDAAGEPVATANSTVDGALEIETADMDVDRRDEGQMVITIGSLSCFAEDSR